uniref:Uncharacterized protein n=1 Tax=Pan troglodytes TaxID=9598 RepID=A0A2I3RL88_PANTR
MQTRGVGPLWLEGWVVGGGDRREAWSGTRSSSAETGGGGGQIAFFLEPWAPHGQLECSEQLSPWESLCRREVSRAGAVPLAHPSYGCTLDQSPNLSVPWKQGNGRATVQSGKVSPQHSCPLEPPNWLVGADGLPGAVVVTLHLRPPLLETEAAWGGCGARQG